MRNEIQQMAYRVQNEITEKQNEAVCRAVQRFYGSGDHIDLVTERAVYSMEGGDAVLRDKKTDKIIILIQPYTKITHDYGVALHANYLTFDGKK